MILNLFAGPGGWEEGLRLLSVDETVVGIEKEHHVIETREAAGLRSHRASVRKVDPLHYKDAGVTGLIASPPCQAFSSAGQRQAHVDGRGMLVWEPLRYVSALLPEWVAMEEVPAVLPVWQVYRDALRLLGYGVRACVLDAANFGLPQNRERAILLASREHAPVLPAPTHHEAGSTLFGGKPWVTMADALGLEPGWRYDSGQNSTMGGGRKERYVRSCDRPAGTVTGKVISQWVLLHDELGRKKLTIDDGCVLQGFSVGYPFAGKREDQLQQLGDAVPPPFAAAVLAPLFAARAEAAA